VLLNAQTLAEATPRLVSSVQVIPQAESPVQGLESLTKVLASQIRRTFGIKVSAKVVADILGPFLRFSEHPIDRLGSILDILSSN
jgi:hypothetical protein